MYFTKEFSKTQQSGPITIISRRTAVRAIIVEQEQILMVRSDRGYYKLPGGGVEKGESRADALKREVAEETGFIDCRIIEELGTVTEQRPDQSVPDAYFHMESHHFLCELGTREQFAQSLIGYELEEGYRPVWITISEAIDANVQVYATDQSNVFIPRENFVLEWLQEHYQK